MQMTVHKTRSVFERYNIVSECDLVEAAKKLNTLQPGPPGSDRDGHNSGRLIPALLTRLPGSDEPGTRPPEVRS